MRRWLALAAVASLAVLAAVAMIAPGEIAAGLRAAFLTASAPVLGAVLMLAIARLTGADWSGFAALAALAPAVIVASLLIGVLQIGADLPEHLQLYQHPLFVGLRALIFSGGLAFAGMQLRRGADTTFAAVALALYAVLVTPIAFDWMLGGAPGHAVSAAGMILFTEQFGGACAGLLLFGGGSTQLRADAAKLLVAAALGLGYLAFMDFLIEWYGDLPSSIGWYVERSTPWMIALAGLALVLGVFGVIAALTLWQGAGRRRLAGASALAGLLLFNLWWAGGGGLALVAAAAGAALSAASCAWWCQRRETAHG